MRVHIQIMFLAWCSVKINTFCNLSGSRQPSWIFVVPTSSPRMAHCHPTDLSSGTHNLCQSAKKTLDDQTFPGSLQYSIGWQLDQFWTSARRDGWIIHILDASTKVRESTDDYSLTINKLAVYANVLELNRWLRDSFVTGLNGSHAAVQEKLNRACKSRARKRGWEQLWAGGPYSPC